MLQLKSKTLSAAAASDLRKYQEKVNVKTTFAEKVSEGKRLFLRYNRTTNPTFKEVREVLAKMSGNTVRCNYCEDSAASQVEHIYPKDFYPEKCFDWENYCYACDKCNQPKSNKFAIFDATDGTEKDLKKDIIPGSQPPVGDPLLLDPRADKPLDFLFLDISDTFMFVAFQDDIKAVRRADYTIETLALNARSHLVRARRVAFVNFECRLMAYVHKKEAGASNAELDELIDSLKSEHHQTVWREMIRQRHLHPRIDDLFNRAPEAVTWI